MDTNERVATYYFDKRRIDVYACYASVADFDARNVDFYDVYDAETGECLNEGDPYYEFPTQESVLRNYIKGEVDTVRAVKATPMKLSTVKNRAEADLLRALGAIGCMVTHRNPPPDTTTYHVIFPHRFNAAALLRECRARKWERQSKRLFPDVCDCCGQRAYFVVRGRLFAAVCPSRGEVTFTLD